MKNAPKLLTNLCVDMPPGRPLFKFWLKACLLVTSYVKFALLLGEFSSREFIGYLFEMCVEENENNIHNIGVL